jgi:hypothetical protein
VGFGFLCGLFSFHGAKMKIGTNLIIKGKNAKASGKIVEHKCPTWTVIDIMEEVSFSERIGPWIRVSPNNGKTSDPFSMVVHSTNDLNYEVNKA